MGNSELNLKDVFTKGYGVDVTKELNAILKILCKLQKKAEKVKSKKSKKRGRRKKK